MTSAGDVHEAVRQVADERRAGPGALEGDVEAQVTELVNLLKNDSKVL